jgi:hypothetical protein
MANKNTKKPLTDYSVGVVFLRSAWLYLYGN